MSDAADKETVMQEALEHEKGVLLVHRAVRAALVKAQQDSREVGSKGRNEKKNQCFTQRKLFFHMIFLGFFFPLYLFCLYLSRKIFQHTDSREVDEESNKKSIGEKNKKKLIFSHYYCLFFVCFFLVYIFLE